MSMDDARADGSAEAAHDATGRLRVIHTNDHTTATATTDPALNPGPHSADERRTGWLPTRWALWAQRPRLIAYCLSIEVITLTITGIAVATRPAEPVDVLVLAGLVGMGVAQAEFSRWVERQRRRLVHATPHINMTSTWTFAAVILLPPAMVAMLVAALYAHLAVRSWYRLRGVPVFRTIFNACLATLTCYSAHATLSTLGVDTSRGGLNTLLTGGHPSLVATGWAIVAAGASYFVVGALIAIPGLRITTWSAREVFGSLADNALEIATLCLGAFTAVALGTLWPLALLVIPPTLLVHRGALAKQLEVAATVDAKTGLWNLSAWRQLVTHELARAQRRQEAKRRQEASCAVLMIDLDHFKTINDRYGHANGDVALKVVADTITTCVRNYDFVGRFGGEEYVALLRDVDQPTALKIAERIRSDINDLTVTSQASKRITTIDDLSASIGVAMYPQDGTSVDRLIDTADIRMYEAKNTGRNRVASFPRGRDAVTD